MVTLLLGHPVAEMMMRMQYLVQLQMDEAEMDFLLLIC